MCSSDLIELRHLPVEQRQVRLLFLDHRDRLPAGRGFADDRDVLERPEQREQERPRGPLVVGHHDAQPGAHTAARLRTGLSATFSVTGSLTVTIVPTPAVLSIDKHAAGPY